MRIAPVSAKPEVQPTDSKALMNAIAEEAQKLWGEQWFAHLVRRYCEIEESATGQAVEPKKRRSTIERALETGNINLETATWLAAAIGAQLQMAIHRIEIKKL